MYRSLPVSNRILSKKWEERNQAIHLKKLNEMKHTQKTIKSLENNQHKLKLRKDKFTEERNIEIARDNEVLNNKIAMIHNSPPFLTKAKQYKKSSLNKQARKKKLLQINAENEVIYQRLQSKNSTYSAQIWEQDHKTAVRRAMNISEFPYIIGPAECKLPASIK